MIFKDEQEIFKYIQKNESVTPLFAKARDYNSKLLALIDGEGFIEEFINHIAFVETPDRALIKKKYSRNIADTFERLMQPIGNVFSSLGGNVDINIKSKSEKKDYLKRLSNIRDDKSLKQYIQSDFVQVNHIDPNGVTFLEFDTKEGLEIYPTYKRITKIRHYIPKGQLVECILFEPKEVDNHKEWRLVDDEKDYLIKQVGTHFEIIDEFNHPFGTPPAIINSDIIDVNSDIRLSPFHKILGLMTELAHNQSNKSIYKIVQGNPIHWRMGNSCQTCRGAKTIINSKGVKSNCITCNGKGHTETIGVEDVKIIPYPREGEAALKEIAGFVSTDINYLEYIGGEIKDLISNAYFAQYGSEMTPEKSETATGRFIDQQPLINKLHKYSNSYEWVNWKLAMWIGDLSVKTKVEGVNVISLSYGKRFIIETPDTILERYEASKRESNNTVILDRLLNEYITSKYANDFQELRLQLIKSRTEPYVHLSFKDVNEIFGQIESKRKIVFQDFWEELDKTDLTEEKSKVGFDVYFEENVLSEIDPLLKTLSSISPLVANKIIEKMDTNEIRKILNLEPIKIEENETSSSKYP